MNGLTVAAIRAATGAVLATGDANARADGGVSTDTRSLGAGAVFFALRGERFDGHDFVAEAVAAGAAAVVVEQAPVPLPTNGCAVLVVADALRALQRLAAWWRDQMSIPVVGITGSNGKTSTKDFTAAVLETRWPVSATKGNLNNHIGLPLSVLATTPDDGAAVWELGMNHPGEIALLCEIARPRIGIITNVGSAHLEFMGSRAGIAEEKSALARSLPSDGTLVVPANCEFADYFRSRTKARVLAVGNGRGTVRAEDLSFADGRAHFRLVIDGEEPVATVLPVDGRHMVTNAMLAAGAGHVLGLKAPEIAAGLAAARLAGGRLGRIVRDGVILLDDSYNANPESMAAALETLAAQQCDGGRRIAVLGHMAELGTFAPEAHERIGRLAASHGLMVVAVSPAAAGIAAGARAAGGQALEFDSAAGAAAWLRSTVTAGDVVLFKGSRTAAVERVMNQAFPLT